MGALNRPEVVPLRSMTGYGRGSHSGSDFNVQVEIRSVNHRFRDIVVRAPHDLMSLVEPIRGRIAQVVERGRIEVFVAVEPLPHSRRLKVDEELARAYYDALVNLATAIGLEEQPALHHLLRFSDIITPEDRTSDPEALWQQVAPAIDEALDGLGRMRSKEGDAIRRDFLHRIELLSDLVQSVHDRAPAVVDEYRRRLQERIKELIPGDDIDETRLMTEIVLFAERSDITEELVRLRSHIQQLRSVLDEEGAVGRKLEFLLQEIHREVNTIGSKSHDAGIANAVMQMKAELEKMREQAQNVE